ncbi:hypothetical protein BC830DRAFT_238603 [Chytriomyces sp. MP71]|nr:hypothetical protein BC830DRAFT_238603 [Chytriomyces sp. MP71]
MSSVFYNPGSGGAHALLISLKPLIYVISLGNLQWIVYYWIGSDYLTWAKHIAKMYRSNNLLAAFHFLIILGICVTFGVSVAPAVLSLASPMSRNEFGTSITSDLHNLAINNPLDISHVYQINQAKFSTDSTLLGVVQNTRNYSGIGIGLSDGNGGTIQGVLFNRGIGLDDNSTSFYASKIYLAVTDTASGFMFPPEYRNQSSSGLNNRFAPNAGDDILVFSQSKITYMQEIGSASISDEQLSNATAYDSTASWNLWMQAIANQKSVQVITNSALGTYFNISGAFLPDNSNTCQLPLMVNGNLAIECAATILGQDASGASTVTFASLRYIKGPDFNNDATLAYLSYYSMQYKVFSLIPQKPQPQTPLLKPGLTSKSDQSGNATVFQSALFTVPGLARSDAMSLALACMVALNPAVEFNGLFFDTNPYPVYDVAVLFIILCCLVVGTIIIQFVRHFLYRRLKKVKNQNVDFLVEYDLVIESLTKRDSVSSKRFSLADSFDEIPRPRPSDVML